MKRVFTRARAVIKTMQSARHGVAAVEFALLAPTLLMLFGAAVSFGDALRVRCEVGNAARAGADYAALHGYNAINIQAAAQGATSLGVNVTVISILSPAECLTMTGSAPVLDPSLTTCSSKTSTGAPPGLYVTVTASTLYHYLVGVPGIIDTTAFMLSGAAIARVQ